jgi:hypothetical protein
MLTHEQSIYVLVKWTGGGGDFCDEGIVKLMQRPDKCLNHNRDYAEK